MPGLESYAYIRDDYETPYDIDRRIKKEKEEKHKKLVEEFMQTKKAQKHFKKFLEKHK